MLKKLLVMLPILFVNYQLDAQNKKVLDKSASLSTAFGSSAFSASLGYQHLWKLGKKQKWAIGGGLRFTSYFGDNQYYITAPANLTKGKTGPGVLFADDISQNIDSVLFSTAQLNALNISVNFAYNFNKRFALGFNIDAIGFTFGSEQNGIYYANNGAGAAAKAKPTGFNWLLIGDNDKGTLNSEFYGRYQFKNKWGAKLGYQYLFTEYTTNTTIQTTPDGQKNDRFRYKSSAVSVGVTYAL